MKGPERSRWGSAGRPRATAVAFAACAVLVATSGCTGTTPGSGPPGPTSTQTSTGPTTGTPPTSPVAVTPSTAPSASSSATSPGEPETVVLSEADNGREITVGMGARVRLVLHNTYWTLGATDRRVLALEAGPTVEPAPRGTCLPGVGCGTVSATYRSVGPGVAELSASRTTCGEAMGCPPGQGTYRVSVVVR